MDRWRGKVAVVTGASAGIGAAIAEKLVEEGLVVVALARRSERLKELSERLLNKNGKFHAITADVTKEDDVLNAFDWISKNLGFVNVLVNNAGIREQTSLIDGDTEMWKRVLDTNVLSLCVATREAVKTMKKENIDGHIIHINSMCGHKVPNSVNLNVYPASKHAVTALTETLRQELSALGSKIKVSSISPGSVATEILDKFVLEPDVIEKLKRAPRLKAKEVADAVIYVLSTPPHVQVHELIISALGER